jgi:methylenetetrahydrofolate--tRNA-(uracil-5-)-methyltransferase
VRLIGQITGVEGYLESAATGLAAALYLSLERQGRTPEPFPPTTAFGALTRHLTESDPKHFQPANINYGLFTELAGRMRKDNRRAAFAERARSELAAWAERHGIEARVERAPCAV